MKYRKTIRLPVVFLCLIYLLAVQTAFAQQPVRSDQALPEAAPSYTDKQAQAALKEVLPLVEEITGKKFISVPPVKLVTRRQLTSARTLRTLTQVGAKYAFGMYISKSIYLLPGNFRPKMDASGVSRKYDKIILKMIVAHELTHALQDQRAKDRKPVSAKVSSLPLQKNTNPTPSYWPPRPSGERLIPIYKSHTNPTVSNSMDAIRATMEGHAMFVMDKVAQKLGQAQAQEEFHKTISVGLVTDTSPGKEQYNKEQRERGRSIYLDGEKFIAWHYKRGGNERVWQIIKNPPAEWSMIERPETYPITTVTK